MLPISLRSTALRAVIQQRTLKLGSFSKHVVASLLDAKFQRLGKTLLRENKFRKRA